MVPVGNPGNPADMRYVRSEHPNGVGAVAHLFRMGKTEVTNVQYVEFLNAVADDDPYGLYNTEMDSDTRGGITRSGASGSYIYSVKAPAVGQGPGGSDYMYDDKPVVFVSWGDAVRFANWLHNDQPTGAQDASTTEDGAYTIDGAITIAALNAVTRNPGARWWLPSEDEWYKAAYYDPLVGVYYDYPTGTNTFPNNNLPSADTGNSANIYDYFTSSNPFTTGNYSYPLTNAGAYTLSDSPYGTFDQGGNIWEWNERLFDGLYRGLRGGSWFDDDSYFSTNLGAAFWFVEYPGDQTFYGDFGYIAGFRVATLIPEPGSVTLCVVGVMMLMLWRRKK
jgi:formylglycine-generating enzyme required for sulfatase activity